MEEEVKTMLDDELKKELQDMYMQNPGDPGYAEATERLAKLYKLKIDQDQAEQSVMSKKDWWIKLGLDIAGIAAPLIFYGVWMKRGFEFEKTGSFTSTTFKGLFNRFRPTR